MLVVRLERAMDEYRKRSGQWLTWKELAEQVGVEDATLRNIRRPGHSTSMRILERIAKALEMKVFDFLEEVPDPEPLPDEKAAKKTTKKKAKKKVGKKTEKKKTKKKA